MTGMVEMWKVEWWAGGSGDHVGVFNRELIEGDDEACSRLMDLTVDMMLSPRRRTEFQAKRRARSWLRLRPVDNGTNGDDWKHVDRVAAWRLIDGEWEEAVWTVTAPDIAVTVGNISFVDKVTVSGG